MIEIVDLTKETRMVKQRPDHKDLHSLNTQEQITPNFSQIAKDTVENREGDNWKNVMLIRLMFPWYNLENMEACLYLFNRLSQMPEKPPVSMAKQLEFGIKELFDAGRLVTVSKNGAVVGTLAIFKNQNSNYAEIGGMLLSKDLALEEKIAAMETLFSKIAELKQFKDSGIKMVFCTCSRGLSRFYLRESWTPFTRELTIADKGLLSDFGLVAEFDKDGMLNETYPDNTGIIKEHQTHLIYGAVNQTAAS